MPNLPRSRRRSYEPDKPKRERQATGDQSFYNSPRWRRVSRLYRQKHPLCEVAKAKGEVRAAEVVDHIISITFGGARYDERNLMAMSHHYHNRKSGLETHGCFLATVDSAEGKLPRQRSEVFERL